MGVLAGGAVLPGWRAAVEVQCRVAHQEGSQEGDGALSGSPRAAEALPLPPPGWYAAVERPNDQRYWDGTAWAAVRPPTPVVPTRRAWKAALVVGVVVGVVVLALALATTSERDTPARGRSSGSPDTPREVAAAMVRPEWMEDCLDTLASSSKPTIRRNAVTVCGCVFDDYIFRAGAGVTEDGTLAALDICSKPYQ